MILLPCTSNTYTKDLWQSTCVCIGLVKTVQPAKKRVYWQWCQNNTSCLLRMYEHTLSLGLSPVAGALGGPGMNRPMSWSNPWGMGESALYFACSSNCCSLRSKASLSKHGPLFHANKQNDGTAQVCCIWQATCSYVAISMIDAWLLHGMSMLLAATWLGMKPFHACNKHQK